MPLDPKAKALIDAMSAMPLPPWSELDAVTFRGMMDAGRFPPPDIALAKVSERDIPGPGGAMRVRIYRPVLGEKQPALVYFHGGGFVIGGLDSHDGTCRRLATGAQCVVISVDYRLAPEHVFPAAVEDAYAASVWVIENAASLGLDPKRIALGGDSAGANLAAVAAILMRDRGAPKARHQLLTYPVTDLAFRSESYKTNGVGYFLTRDMMEWFGRQYLLPTQSAEDPLASPLYAKDLSNLPPATVITAEFDPLRDEGEAYARRLTEAGVPTKTTRYDGVFHGFFSMGGLIDQADTAMNWATSELRAAFAG